MRILFDEQSITARIDELACQMVSDLPKGFLLAPVLTGAFIFAADLVRALQKHGADPLVDFVQLSSYGGARTSSGVVTLLKDFSVDIKGKHVLLVDDVLDTGRSLHFGKAMIIDRGAASVRTCVLIKKTNWPCGRLESRLYRIRSRSRRFSCRLRNGRQRIQTWATVYWRKLKRTYLFESIVAASLRPFRIFSNFTRKSCARSWS